MCVPVIFIFLTTTAGRSTAAQDAVCVEVLKTSAGLGLSLDGGKSSMSGDGPLFIKRVYKGNVLENPICHPLPIFFPCMSVTSSWKSNLFLKNLKRFQCFVTYRVYCASACCVFPVLTHVTHGPIGQVLSPFYKRRNWATGELCEHRGHTDGSGRRRFEPRQSGFRVCLRVLHQYQLLLM